MPKHRPAMECDPLVCEGRFFFTFFFHYIYFFSENKHGFLFALYAAVLAVSTL